MAKMFTAFKDGKLLATPLQIPKTSYTSIHLGWEDLICKEGLIIPMNYASALNSVRFFNRQPTIIPGQPLFLQGLLIQLDGDLFSYEISLSSQASNISQLPEPWTANLEVVAEDCTSLYLPHGAEALWARSVVSDQEEAIYASLKLAKTHAEAKALIIQSGIDVAKFYEWYDYDFLVKTARELHLKKYPHHPLYSIAPEVLSSARPPISK